MLSGLQADQYWYALNASVWVTDNITSDLTGGALFFYSGVSAPPYDNYLLNLGLYNQTLIVPNKNPNFWMTFIAPIVPSKGGGG